jgi:SAM-dependent methyltransferase
MGVYGEQVVPRLVDLACGSAGFDRWRARVAEGLSGRVVEIGFGSGRNVPHYPPEVGVVLAVEPAGVARRLAQPRIAASPVPVEHVGLDGQQNPLDDDSCDAALFTFTLCTVPNPEKVLSELRRVVRPGGTVHFLEHGLSPQPGVAKWQHRIDPFQRRLADGCHLTRDPTTLVEQAGFVMERNEQRYVRGPKPWSWITLGVAAKPAA